MSRAPALKIEPRDFGAVVTRRGRVIFRSRAADARAECREFVRNWCEGGEVIRAELKANLAESVQW